MKKERVCVGLSGGVDSSVAAKRLIERGYEVIGVFIKTWYPDFITCTMEAERLDAMRVAAHLGIPFLTCDAEQAYKEGVADYMIREYGAGRTPNPDVMCNREVKFGAFYAFAQSLGASYVATGHYARIEMHDSAFALMRGIDPEKDQSYFLWTLRTDELPHILLPLGESCKRNIREEAKAARIPTAEKHDSQGICFLGEVDMEAFLSHYITPREGFVVTRDGKVIGKHQGAHFLTLGQRHGFTITNPEYAKTPWYVAEKHMQENMIVVAQEPVKVTEGSIVRLTNVNAIRLNDREECSVQFRYRQAPIPAHIYRKDEHIAEVHLAPGAIVDTPSPGQSCVFFRGDLCLGGGIIESVG